MSYFRESPDGPIRSLRDRIDMGPDGPDRTPSGSDYGDSLGSLRDPIQGCPSDTDRTPSESGVQDPAPSGRWGRCVLCMNELRRYDLCSFIGFICYC